MKSISDFQVGSQLGKGGFASVFHAICINSGKEYAIKMIDKEQMNKSGMQARVRQEVEIHYRLKHPSVLELFAFFEDHNFVYLVLELCHYGELARYQKDHGLKFTESEARVLFSQVVHGLQYLHNHGIIHRDLTLGNLMLTKDMKIKIGDFGLATKLDNPGERHVTMCGTPNFISPEVATRASHGLEADIWGLGCLLYAMIVGWPPFDTKQVKSTIINVVRCHYKMPENISEEAKDLISNMLKPNPSERIKLADIPSHHWMKLGYSSLDSGVYSMSVTNFSSNSVKPAPKIVSTFPVLEEYSEENEIEKFSFRRPLPPSTFPSSNQNPQRRPTSPPVKLMSDPRDLIGFSQAPLDSLKAKISSLPSKVTVSVDCAPQMVSHISHHPSLSRQFSNPETDRVLSSVNINDLENRSIRSNFSDPSKYQYQNPHNFQYNQTSSVPSIPHLPNSVVQPDNANPISSLNSVQYIHQSQTSTVSQQHYNPVVSQSQAQCHAFLPSQQYNIVPTSEGICSNKPAILQPQNNYHQNEGPSNPQTILRQVNSRVVTPALSPRIISVRLRPTRQRTKNVVAIITESGEVCLEFVKNKMGQEKISEVMRISADGDRIVLETQDGSECNFFCYDTLPQKYWKKYEYAARFVNLVKASTPKITLYTTKAKCYLMENDGKDFEVYFYNGVKGSRTSEDVKLIDANGINQTFTLPFNKESMSSVNSLYLDHLTSSFDHCIQVESLLSRLGNPEQPTFPLVLGRKPQVLDTVSNNSLEKENRVPEVVVPGISDMMLSKVTLSSPYNPYSSNQQHKPSSLVDRSRRVFVPGVGDAIQSSDGSVRVNYQDSSYLVLRNQSNTVEYFHPNNGGHSVVYDQSNMPEVVRQKLLEMPKILDILKASDQHGFERANSVR